MKYEFSIIHIACSQCSKKTHCEQCNRELSESILRIEGVADAQSYIRDEKLIVECNGLSENALIDELEGIGLLVD